MNLRIYKPIKITLGEHLHKKKYISTFKGQIVYEPVKVTERDQPGMEKVIQKCGYPETKPENCFKEGVVNHPECS